MGLVSATNALLILFCYIVYKQILSYLSFRRFEQFAHRNGCEPPPPGPSKWPWSLDRFIRVLRIGQTGEDLLDDYLCSAYKELGRYTYFGTGPFGKRSVQTIEPDNIKAILATNFKDYELASGRYKQFSPLLGKGIFTTDGEAWEHSRALFRPQFARDMINDLDSIERHVQALFRAIPKANDGWTTEFDLMPLLFRLTLDTATEFLFGESVNTQSSKNPYTALSGQRGRDVGNSRIAKSKTAMDYDEAFTIIGHYVYKRMRYHFLYFVADGFEFRNAIRTLKGFADLYVRKAFESAKHDIEKRPSATDGRKEKFVLLKALVQDTQDPEKLRDELLALLLAGRDTTSSFLTWVFLLLCRNPRVFNKLRNEIMSTFPPNARKSQENLSFASLKSCRYLQHTMLETLRLYSIIYVNIRVAIRNTVLPIGGGPSGTAPLAVKKDDAIIYSTYALHRRPDLWGPDPDQFRPERWEGRKSGWDFLPFNGGPRVCLGQQYALTETGYVIVRMLQTFDKIEGIGPGTSADEKPNKALGVTLYPRDGIKIRLRIAND
ncbi:cytochrome P450 [Patellaria atrata CBS 101060]|uniref:Cytochrome P450 n=1 Tax=Patellaria atrata CBS 101060 TaxID=1346257 RepID=A0A9P4S6E2_9PEZI|nr:cytochrome P450 [Patellaria atrata CBS 101060]